MEAFFFFKCTSETYCHRELQSQTALGCSKSLNSWTTGSYMDTTQMTQGCTGMYITNTTVLDTGKMQGE